MKKSKIYTGRGDKGMTSLADGVRVPKTHPRLESYGMIDELNAFIGLLATSIEDTEILDLLSFIQVKLFTVGAYLTINPSKTVYQTENRLMDECIKKIENAIDLIDCALPKMKSFVLPRGSHSAALAHVCRVVCRRAERMIFRLSETEKIEPTLLIFINRLSDLLFVIARKECLSKKGEEIFLK